MATVIIGVLLLAAFAAAVRHIYKNWKKGDACGGCSGCALSKDCCDKR